MTNPPPIHSQPKRAHLSWVLSTYFAQGFPFTVVRILSAVFFTDMQAKERYLGYLNFLGLPWNLKFLWAPLLDAFSTTRRWQIFLQGLIALIFFGMAALCFFAQGASNTAPFLVSIVAMFIFLGFLSASNDIAIDAFYMEGLAERKEQALYSGHRVLAYRLAIVYGRSGIVAIVSGVATWLGSGNMFWAWSAGFAAAGVTMLILAGFHLLWLPTTAQSIKPASVESFYVSTLNTYREAFRAYLRQDKVWLVLLFIVTYKIGDEVLFSMNTPFLKRELGISNAQYAFVSGIVGAVATILGAMLGGWWIKKVGLRRAIWPLTLIMNLNIWWYVALAYFRPDPTLDSGILVIGAVHFIEQISAGLGSAALLIFLLGTCHVNYKAAHYAIGSAIMSVPATAIGGFCGEFVQHYGYLSLFLTSFVVTIPATVLLFFVPIKE